MRFRIYDEKKFDSVSMMRSIRDRNPAEIEGMSLEEEPHRLASQEIRYPFLKRFRHRPVQQPAATDGVRARAEPERSAAKELPAVVGVALSSNVTFPFQEGVRP